MNPVRITNPELSGNYPQPKFAGKRFQIKNVTGYTPPTAIFVVDPEGYLRHVPGDGPPPTYWRLFRTAVDNEQDVNNWRNIAIGPPLSEGAVLVRCEHKVDVFLVSNGIKRHIADMPTFEVYQFCAEAIISLPAAVFNAIPTGPTWGPVRPADSTTQT